MKSWPWQPHFQVANLREETRCGCGEDLLSRSVSAAKSFACMPFRMNLQLLNLIAYFFRPQMSDDQETRLKKKIEFIEFGDFRWYNKLSAIDDRKILRVRQAGFFGMLGTLCALAQNEWLMAGGSPLDFVMFTFKVVSSSCIRALSQWHC